MEIDSFVSCTVITKHVFRNNPSVAGVTVKNENSAAPGFDVARHLVFWKVVMFWVAQINRYHCTNLKCPPLPGL